MSKRNITYTKPQDPKFLQQIKQQIGYKEGTSVETKRQKLEDLEDDSSNVDRPQREDEKPQIVVLNSGDLTAEEVAAEEKRIAKEAAELPADLSKPIFFRKRQKAGDNFAVKKNKDKSSKKISKKNIVKLSFDAEEEDQ